MAVLGVALSVAACAESEEPRGPAAAVTPAVEPSPTSVATAPPTSTSIGVKLETTVTSDEVVLRVPRAASRGELAVVSARTAANAECFITVRSASGRVEGLRSRYADAAGAVSWSWTLDASAPSGEWTVEVRCTTASGISAAAREVFHVD
ncbi:MAG: hypothetical protein ACRDGE_03895 [Candidatus Limnocylindria bacterium]